MLLFPYFYGYDKINVFLYNINMAMNENFKATNGEANNPGKLEERLRQEAEEALRQIDQKGYEAEILSSGCKKIIRYGAAFSGKKAVILQPPGQQKPKKMPYEEWG